MQTKLTFTQTNVAYLGITSTKGTYHPELIFKTTMFYYYVCNYNKGFVFLQGKQQIRAEFVSLEMCWNLTQSFVYYKNVIIP